MRRHACVRLRLLKGKPATDRNNARRQRQHHGWCAVHGWDCGPFPPALPWGGTTSLASCIILACRLLPCESKQHHELKENARSRTVNRGPWRGCLFVFLIVAMGTCHYTLATQTAKLVRLRKNASRSILLMFVHDVRKI